MTRRSLSFASVARDHVEAWQRLAWFAIESAEREQLITLKAWWATLGMLLHVGGPRRPAGAAGDSTMGPASSANPQRACTAYPGHIRGA